MSRHIKSYPILSLMPLFLLLGVFLVPHVSQGDQGQEVNSEKIFIISDEKLQEHDVYMRSEVEKALREAVRRYYANTGFHPTAPPRFACAPARRVKPSR